MKKMFLVVLAVLIGFAFVTTTFAQDKAPAKAADKPAVAADKAPAGDAAKAADAKNVKAEKKVKKAKKAKKEEKKEEAPAPAK
jgi:hypothetical protein